MKKFILALIIVSALQATTYYVSSSGNDANTGLTVNLAWQTLAKVNATTLSPDDHILLKCGDTWREQLTIGQSGSAGQPIVISNYGLGNNPLILGSKASTTWTDQGSNVWKSDITFTEPKDVSGNRTANIFFLNNDNSVSTGIHKTNSGELITNYNWYWSANYIYVYSTVNPSTVWSAIEASQRNEGILLSKKNYITIDGVDIKYTESIGINGGQGVPTLAQTDIIVRNCELSFIGYPNGAGYGIDVIASNVLIENNTIHDHGRRGVSAYLYGNLSLSNIVIQNNYFYNGYHTIGVDLTTQNTYTANITNVTIQRNRIEATATGVTTAMSSMVANDGLGTMTNIKFQYNLFTYCNNLNVRKVNSIYFYNNTFYKHNEVNTAPTFFYIENSAITSYNNVFYSQLTTDTSWKGLLYDLEGTTTATSDYNVFYRTSAALKIFYANAVGWRSSDSLTIRNTLGFEAHSLFVDPKINSTTHKQEFGSPCRNKGTDLGLLTDIDGNAIIGTPDVGAYEYLQTYYVSNMGNDSNTGLSEDQAWLTLAKVNATIFIDGDRILLKRGDTFPENIIITESGTLANPIYIGAYGSGAKPILTGLVSVTSWTNLGSNIWESTGTVSSQPTVDMVTINGVNTAMGRYPNLATANQGYLTYQSHSGSTSITSSSLTGTPDWTGAEVVLKTNLWTETKKTITSQSGGTLNFSATSTVPTNDYGFFIQNDARTLDKQGEWYFNPSTKKLKMYSTSQPSGVKVCADDTLILISGNYVIVDNLNVTGSNTKGIYVYKYNATPNHVTIQNCDFSYSGGTAIYCRGNHITVEGNTITTSNRCAIDADACRISSIRNNTITDTYLLHGLLRQGAIMAQSSVVSTVIEYNRIVNSGTNAINTQTDSVMLVKNNYIDNFSLLVADNGGIYLGGAGSYPMTITANVILNGIGNCFGTTDTTQSGSRGIYVDDGCLNMEVSYNSIANIGSYGMMIHNSSSINIHHNTVYNSEIGQLLFSNNSDRPYMVNNVTENNIFVSKTANQSTLRVVSQYTNTGTMGTFNYNYYARPIDDNTTISIAPGFSLSNISLADWKTHSSQDANSKKSFKTVTTTDDLVFIYNETNATKDFILTYPAVDVTGQGYSETVTLQPYTSKVLISAKNRLFMDGKQLVQDGYRLKM
jgi:hypothetical protein